MAINAASMSCACPRSPKGLSPSAHLADGTTDLILVRKCSRLNFLHHLLRHTNKDDQVPALSQQKTSVDLTYFFYESDEAVPLMFHQRLGKKHHFLNRHTSKKYPRCPPNAYSIFYLSINEYVYLINWKLFFFLGKRADNYVL